MYYYPLCTYLLKCVYTCIPSNIFLSGIECKWGSPEAPSEKDIRVQKVQSVQSESAPVEETVGNKTGRWERSYSSSVKARLQPAP